MKLHRFRTHAGFVYYSHKDSAQAEWKVERDFCAPCRRYTVCRLERQYLNGVLYRAEWYVQHDAITLNDARLFITSQMNPKAAAQ